MKFLFNDESFSFEALRTASFGPYGGADLGEVIVTARAIADGDEEAWFREWNSTAERVHERGRESLLARHSVSAREALLRASNYYRTSEFYLRDDPFTDQRAITASAHARETFRIAAESFDSPVHVVEIPYEGTFLPGYLFLVDDTDVPRPTVVFTSGFDSIAEEAYFAVAAAAIRRGYNCLAYDGPGQGAALREGHQFFRPDWESVLTPVIDYAVSRPEIDPERIALHGYSLGGLLVARASAYEHRPAAMVLDDGLYSYFEASTRMVPPAILEAILAGNDTAADEMLRGVMEQNTSLRWAIRNGIWTFGADSVADYVRRSESYTLEGLTEGIATPALIFDPDNDFAFKGEPRRMHEALSGRSTLVTLHEADGLGEHCSYGGRSTIHQIMFDWLDESMPKSGLLRPEGANRNRF